MLAFFASIFGDGVIYIWLMNAVGVTGFIFWLGIAASHYRFRKAYIAQGYSLDDLPYKSKWFPFGPIFSFALCFFVLLAQNYQAFIGDDINWASVIAAILASHSFDNVAWL